MAAPTVTADYKGGIAGQINGGSIINSYNCGAINSSTDAASVYANIMVAPSAPSGESSGSYIGGIAGYVTNSCKITNVYNRGKVEGSAYVGGIVGQLSSGTVTYAYYLNGCATNGISKVQYGVGASLGIGTTADTGTIIGFSENQQLNTNDEGFTTLLSALQTWQQQPDNISYFPWIQGSDGWPKLNNSITIKYNGNGATSGVMADQTAKYSDVTQLNENTFTKDGYTVTFNYNGSGQANTTQTTNYSFSGWKASVAGGYWGTTADAVTGAIYTSTTIPNNAYVKNLGSLEVTLTAQWLSGSITLPTPTRAGFIFASWNTASDGSGTRYYGGRSYTPSANITLYAQWVSWTVGSGTEADPFVITTETELRQLADDVNKRTHYGGTYFKLGNDITLNQQFYPIGYSSSRYFAGTFDGDRHTISGLNVTGHADGSKYNVGLFGYTNGATIKNLTVSGTVSGTYYVGGIVGMPLLPKLQMLLIIARFQVEVVTLEALLAMQVRALLQMQQTIAQFWALKMLAALLGVQTKAQLQTLQTLLQC